MRLLYFVTPALLLAALLGGCQRAEHYGPRTASEPLRKTPSPSDTPPKARTEPPLDPDIGWIDVFDLPKPDVRIEFVHAEKAPAEWDKLKDFWNAAELTRPAALIGLPPLTASSLAANDKGKKPVLKIKVPLGLPDPREYIPAGNPLTLGKWKLGQRLFFDDSWLEAKAGTSCATCHRPDHGFADREHMHRDGFNTPTLVNCAFNSSQFWDGRAGRLEEVIQRTLEDERASDPPKPFRHTWSGVIHRLRDKPMYHEPFNDVFGTPPSEKDGKEMANITQDTVGRALATYLRTILAANSIYDRARAQARKHNATLKAEHFETVLDAAALKELEQEKEKKADVAAKLMHGYRLFFKLDARRPLMNCVDCHSGRNFTDKEFHNLGVGATSRPGQEAGRFAQMPIGQKNRYLIDAYKTPTLRNLPRTTPYFHNGSESGLREVVEFYNKGGRRNDYLDRTMLDEGGRTRQLGLDAADIDALVLFLNALGGDEVASVIKTPPASGK